jgi:short-subunit dehydrogenase
MRELGGRRALITGATGGIGRAIARAFAQEQMELVLSGRRPDVLAALERELGAETVQADLADPAEVDRLAEEAGAIDVLVNNAGVEQYAWYTDVPREELERIVALNIRAPMLLIHRLLPGMLQRGQGHVVNVSSLAGHASPAHQAAYATTKAALIALARSLRAEYRHTPVGFSVVSPSFVTGEGMHADSLERYGLRAPFPPGAVSVDRCARAVVRAIRRDVPEVLVAPMPIRPLIALDGLSPRLGAAIVRIVGVNELFRRAADRRREEQNER